MTEPAAPVPEPIAALLARTIAELSARPGTVAIELVGSLARGQFRSGSDLDVQVILDREPESDESWVFDVTGVAVNAHYEALDAVIALADATPETFGAAVRAEWLPDRLTGARTLWVSDDDRGRGWGALRDRVVARRHDPTELPGIVEAFLAHGRSLLERGRDHLGAGAPLDAWQCARDAAATLAHGQFVRAGRIIRGLKRTPELLREIDQHALAAALVATVGGPLTTEELLELADRRTRFRETSARYVAALEAGESPVTGLETRRWQEHATNAVDYYRSLIDDGYGDGMLNHLRTLSGAVKLPATALDLLGTPSLTPYETWGAAEPPEVVHSEWMALMGFARTSDDADESAGRALALIEPFARA